MQANPKKKVTEQIYKFEVQDSSLQEDLLSQIGSVPSDDEQPEIGQKELYVNWGGGKEYSPHQKPPSLELAELFWDSSGVGLSSTKSGGNYSSYPLQPKIQRYPLFTNPLKIKGWGTTIQLYFLFCLCCLFLVFVQFFGMFYLAVVFREDYCQKQKQKTGKDCSFFDLETHKMTYPKSWFNEAGPEIQQKAGLGFIFVYISIYVMYAVIIIFTVIKVKLRMKYRENMKETIASEFTLMVEDVDGNMEGAVDKVTEFITTTVEKEGSYSPPQIEKFVLAKASGIIARTQEQLKNRSKELQAIQKEMKEQKFEEDPEKTKSRRKIFKSLEKVEQKKIHKITKKISRFESRRILLKNKDKNSIAFISFETNIQRDQVLQAYRNIYEKSCLPFTNPKPKYRLSPASEPDNIEWDKIGFTPCQAFLRACISRPLIGLLVPVFIVMFFFVNVVFSALYAAFKTKFIETILNVGLFVVIKIFTFVTLMVMDGLSTMELSLEKDSHSARKVFLTSVLKVFYVFLGYVFVSYNAEIETNNSGTGLISLYSELSNKILKYLIMASFLSPSLLVFQYKHLCLAYERYKIKQNFNKRDKEEEKVDSKYFYLTQGMLNEYYERPDMQIDTKYTLVYSVIFLYALLGYTAPILTSVLIFLAIIAISLIDMKLMYSRYKKPQHDNKNLSDHMIRRLIAVPKLVTHLFWGVQMRGTGTELLIETIFRYSLGFLFLVNFNFVLKKLENYVEMRHLTSAVRRERHYSEQCSIFETDYESEYKGVKRSVKRD